MTDKLEKIREALVDGKNAYLAVCVYNDLPTDKAQKYDEAITLFDSLSAPDAKEGQDYRWLYKLRALVESAYRPKRYKEEMLHLIDDTIGQLAGNPSTCSRPAAPVPEPDICTDCAREQACIIPMKHHMTRCSDLKLTATGQRISAPAPELLEAHCTKCGEIFSARSIDETTRCPTCGCIGTSELAARYDCTVKE